jgi:hypothetical protein
MDSAGTTFGQQFARELVRPVRLVIWIVVIAAIAVALGVLVNGTAAAVAAVALVVAFFLFTAITAMARGEREFFKRYAAARGFDYVEGQLALPFDTELLRKGKERWSEQTLVGKLPDGHDAVLSLHSYEVVYYVNPKNGQESTKEFQHTIVAAEIPELEGQIRKLTVQPRVGFQFFDSAEDAIKEGRRRVEVESAEFDSRFEVFVGSDSDENMARQILSPSFMVWLTEQSGDVAFEFENGDFVCAARGHLKQADLLDGVWQRAGELVARLRKEGAESARAVRDPRAGLRQLSTQKAGKNERIDKRRAWVIVGLLFVAVGGGALILESESNDTSPAEQAAEDAETEENLQFYEEHKCEINPDLYGCPGKGK